MNTLTISNAAQAVAATHPKGVAASAEDSAETAEAEVSFAGLLGAGIGRSVDAHAPASKDIAKDAKTDADGSTAACDPAALLDAIAAGQANVDPRQLANPAQVAGQPSPAALVPVDPGDVLAKPPKGSTALPDVARADPLPIRARSESAKNVPAADPQHAVDPRQAPEVRRDADPVTIAGAAQSAKPESPAAPVFKPEMPEHRQEAMPAPPSPSGNIAALAQTAQTTHSPTAMAVAAHLEQLAQPFGTPAWDDGFSSRIVWMAKNEVQSAAIRVNPPDLGPIEVKLTLTNDQGTQTTSASVQFSAAHAFTRDAIESALPRLREMLQQNGIALGNTSVDAGNAGNTNGSADSGRQSNNAPRNDYAGGAPPETAVQPHQAVPLRGGNGLVDTFA